MSASHDQSYYEIALTNRQVMSIFVVLLICILAAFLGGVWLGRDADAAVEIVAAQSINATQTGEAPLEELDFFTRREDAAKTADTPGQAEMEREERQAAEKSVPKVSEDAGSPVRGQEKTAVVGTEPPVSRADEPSVPREPAVSPVVAESEGSARPSAPRTDSAATVPESVVIQVFSSNEEAQAQRVVERLRSGGYPAVLSPVEVEGRTLHRVRLGPYTDADEAQVVAESVRRTFKLDTWITN